MEEILYTCEICSRANIPANELNWYFIGAEFRTPNEEPSKPAWYCTDCETTISLRSDPIYKGPRLDNALSDHEKNSII